MAASSLRSALRQMEEAEVVRLLKRLRETPAQAWTEFSDEGGRFSSF